MFSLTGQTCNDLCFPSPGNRNCDCVPGWRRLFCPGLMTASDGVVLVQCFLLLELESAYGIREEIFT